MRQASLITTVAAIAMLTGITVPAHAQVTAYEGARIIVGNGNTVENGTIVVDGNRITQAGASASVKVPAGAKRVDLKGKTVMPTVIDTHTHMSGSREALIRDLRQRAYWGVGAAQSMGADNLALLPMRDEVIPGGARFLSAGRGITRPEPLRPFPTFFINSDEEGREAIRENAKHKVEMVKIWVDDRNGKVQKITPSQYAAIIDEAHKNKMRVTAHIFLMEDAKGLLRAGLDALAHGIRDQDIDDEMVAMFKQRPNLVLNPNLPDRGVKVDRSWLQAGMSAEEFAKLEKGNIDNPKTAAFHTIQARNLAKLNAAGARIVMGTDGNRSWGPHEEMHDMVLAGMTPMQVILASTRNAAEFLRLTDTGTLEAGKSADFIVLDANPLDDITNTRRISAVILRGAAVDRSKPVQ